MTTQAEYKEQYIDPMLSDLMELIAEIKTVRSNIPMSNFYLDTPDVQNIIMNGKRFLEITEFYDLLMQSNMTVTDAIIAFIDAHQQNLFLKKPLRPLVNFKRYLLSLEHGTKTIPDTSHIQLKNMISDQMRKIRENGTPYSKFFDYFSASQKAISEIKVEDTTLAGNSTPATTLESVELPATTFEGLNTEELATVIQNENITSTFLSPVTKSVVLEYRGAIYKTINYIKNSPFKKVLTNSEILIGTKPALSKAGLSYSGRRVIALYWSQDKITYFINKEGKSDTEDKDPFITLIHEFGHRYHSRFIKGGYYNFDFKDLYQEAIKSKEQCYIDQLPKIGDPLSNLRENWWTVRMSSDDYVLTNIFKNRYTYTNSTGDIKEFEKKDILKLITCPSQYGAKNVEEFFAEMFTLIILGKVKPNQKIIADKFMQLVNQESK